MKLFKSLLLLLVVSSSLFAGAKHCIQVTAVHKYKEGNIRKSVLDIINSYDKARIDKRGNRYVLRVGDYKDATSAKRDLRAIRREFSDAFVRRCDYDPIEAIYPPFEDSDVKENTQENNVDFSADIQEEIVDNQIEEDNNNELKALPRVAEESFKYKKQEKYNYEFWRECKKCFAPMDKEINNDYSEEDVSEEVDENLDVEVAPTALKSEADDLYNENRASADEEIVIDVKQNNTENSLENDGEEESNGFFSWLFGSDTESNDDSENIDIDVEDIDLNDEVGNNLYKEEKENVNSELDDINEIEEESTNYYAE